MRPRLFATAFCLIALLAGLPSKAQVSAYRFEPSRVPVGTVFSYEKSQLDGTHLTRVSIYVAAVDRVESLKWDQDGDEATLVQAVIDWPRFSVKRFDAWHLSRGAQPRRSATLEVDGDTLHMSLMDEPVRISHWPWHSYDFDFTSLNLTMPHLRDARKELVFWRTDFVYSDPPAVAELGEISLRFERNEVHGGTKVRRYTIGGAGLNGATGTWWADRRTGLLVEYEIPVGDEPGYDNVRLRLTGTADMSAPQWEQFKRAAVGAK